VHYECLLFCVTDLALIYESVTSSASVFRWLALLSWTLNSLTDELRLDSSEFYITTDGRSASLSWSRAPIWGLPPEFYYCQTVAALLICGALSKERTGLSFTIVSGSRQRSSFRVWVPWDSRPYFTVSDRDFHFRRLLRLAGLRRRYSTLPPHGVLESESELCYDRRSVSQYVLE
jgi:hypothetical protein